VKGGSGESLKMSTTRRRMGRVGWTVGRVFLRLLIIVLYQRFEKICAEFDRKTLVVLGGGWFVGGARCVLK